MMGNQSNANVIDLDQRYVDLARACSASVGPPKWENNWSCPGRYYAEIFKYDGFGFLIEDMEDCVGDDEGFATFTLRRIKLFDSSNILRLVASIIIQGLDERYIGEEKKVTAIEDNWQIQLSDYEVGNPEAWLQNMMTTLKAA